MPEPTTMRAVQLRTLTGADGLEIANVPAPASANHVIIEVHAAGIGFPDLLMTKGKYQFKPDPPFIPGVEAAGVVLSAPESSGIKPGDRVIASLMLGAWAEIAIAHPLSTMPIPDGMSFEEATAMVNYQTAYFGLVWRGGIKAGETVLVHGAAGGTGTSAIQVARGLGANVIAIARGEEKLAVARDAGAHHCVDADAEWLKEVKSITDNRGVDIVYDPVGGDRFTDSVRALAPLGRVLVIGFAAGTIPEVKVNRLLLRNTSVIGVAWGEYVRVDPKMPRTIAAELAKLHAEGHIRPPIGGVYPMERCGDALRALEERRATGKLVLKIR